MKQNDVLRNYIVIFSFSSKEIYSEEGTKQNITRMMLTPPKTNKQKTNTLEKVGTHSAAVGVESLHITRSHGHTCSNISICWGWSHVATIMWPTWIPPGSPSNWQLPHWPLTPWVKSQQGQKQSQCHRAYVSLCGGSLEPWQLGYETLITYNSHAFVGHACVCDRAGQFSFPH